MNRHRDIERVLDAWLGDGSSHMPDRLFEAVLDQVGRTSQRHRPWSDLRFPPMTTRMLLSSATAVAIVVGAVGFALLGGPSDDVLPGSSPSRSPSAPPDSPSPTLLDLGPREIRDYVWLAAPHDAEELGVEVELTALIFRGGRLRFETGLSWILQSELRAGGPNELVFTSVESPGGCSVGDVGRYEWSLTPGGTKLTLDHVQDQCSSRAAVLPGEWQRSACENPDNLCLGPLEAGSYASQFFDPFVPAAGPSKPRFGALTYEVPAGWHNVEDALANYRLARPERTDARIDVFSEVRVVSQADPCLEEPDPDIERTATAITGWLARAPGVMSTDPLAVSVGGLDGWMLDLTMDPDWTPPCSLIDGEGGPYGVLFTDGEPSEGFSWHVRPGTQLRLYVLDLGDGRALLIEIEIGDAANRASLIDEATAIVESFEFD